MPSPSLPAQVSPSPSPSALPQSSPLLSVQLPPQGSSFDMNCVRQEGRHLDNLMYDMLRQLRCERGYARKDSKAALKTRLSAMDATGRKRARGMADAMEACGDVADARGRRSWVDGLRLAFVSEMEVVKRRAH